MRSYGFPSVRSIRAIGVFSARTAPGVSVTETLAMLGRIEEEFRLPLCRMSDANRKALAKVLSELKIA